MKIYSEVLIEVILAVETQLNAIYFFITYIPLVAGIGGGDVSVLCYYLVNQAHKCYVFYKAFKGVDTHTADNVRDVGNGDFNGPNLGMAFLSSVHIPLAWL